jgi:hypothetical protein
MEHDTRRIQKIMAGGRPLGVAGAGLVQERAGEIAEMKRGPGAQPDDSDIEEAIESVRTAAGETATEPEPEESQAGGKSSPPDENSQYADLVREGVDEADWDQRREGHRQE